MKPVTPQNLLRWNVLCAGFFFLVLAFAVWVRIAVSMELPVVDPTRIAANVAPLREAVHDCWDVNAATLNALRATANGLVWVSLSAAALFAVGAYYLRRLSRQTSDEA